MSHTSEVKQVKQRYHDKLEYIISLAVEVRKGKKFEVCDNIVTLDYVKYILDQEMSDLKLELERMDISDKPDERIMKEEEEKKEIEKRKEGN